MSHRGQVSSQSQHWLAAWPGMSFSLSLGFRDPIQSGSSRFLKALLEPTHPDPNPHWGMGCEECT